jgi:hypothetical protein
MGYHLNSLGNLAIDDTVKFYIFFITEGFKDKFSREMSSNFIDVARRIGDEAVIVEGTDKPEVFAEDVLEKYFGEDITYRKKLPVLVITDSHPEKIKDDALRLFVPLSEVETNFNSWSDFFSTLVAFVRNEKSDFKERIRY